MAAYNNFIITNQGIEMLKGLMNGNGSMEFRCLAVGSGYYGPEKNIEEIRAMEGLKEERQRVMFSSIGKSEKGFVNLKANLTNKDLEEGYPMTEAGIYVGKKGESAEILYCVSITDNPDYMPDYSSKKIYNVIFKMLISIGDVTNPTISYNTDIYALAEDLQEEARRAAEAENGLQQRKLDIDGNASNVTVGISEAAELRPMPSQGSLSELLAVSAKAVSVLIGHLANTDRMDNTSDMDKPVSTAQQAALDALYAQLAAFTLQKIADLVNGAPSTMDTLGEIAKAMQDNADVVAALDAAIGRKASAAEFDSHAKDKANPHAVTKAQLGLGNVDNTADADKSVKYAVSAGSAVDQVARDIANGKFGPGWSLYDVPSIELGSSHVPSPFIDFHYSGSTTDYTSRIIESSEGTLEVTGNLQVDGRLMHGNAPVFNLSDNTLTINF